MKRLILSVSFLVALHSATAQFKNIRLAELHGDIYPPSGPSITVNRKNSNNIIAGIAPDRTIYTKDGGVTLSETKLQSPFGVSGYPTVTSDSKGDTYLFHLADPSGKGKDDDSWLDRIICQKSTDEGVTWKSGEPFGYTPSKDQYRAWTSASYKKQDLYSTWTQFDKYGVSDTSYHSNIMFSSSDNEGKKWSKALRINQIAGDCTNGDNTTMGAMSAVDAKGKIFVAWANRGVIYFDRSYDNARTWLQNDIIITQQQGGWEMDIPGMDHSNGLPVLMIDNSPSRYHGSLYLLWADQRNGKNNSDIWFMRSGNGGDNWTTPLCVNKDLPTAQAGEKGKHQFLPWMSVDQTTGNIYIIYYDRRNYDDLQTDVYMAYSADGGSSFTEVKISESPFVPEPNFIVEHTNIAAHKGVITPIWTRIDDGKKSVWMSVIKDTDFLKK